MQAKGCQAPCAAAGRRPRLQDAATAAADCAMFDVAYNPREFDLLATDVHSYELRHDISEVLGTAYLEDADTDGPKDAVGIVWGDYNRVLLAMVLRVGEKRKHIHFLVDTGSPCTYVCQEVLDSFGEFVSKPNHPYSVYINGRPVSVLESPENKHFKDINVLGMDFMNTFGGKLTVDFCEFTAKVELSL